MKISTLGTITTATLLGVAGVTALVTDEVPYPHSGPWSLILDLKLPFLTNRRLDAVLGARPGDRVLEVGPGTGCQSLHVARRIAPSGRLDIVDIQQEFLDSVMRRAEAQNVRGIVPTRADARDLPFADATFDAAYVVCALGEIPEPITMLREFRRVLKPTGRLVIGEFIDRHYISQVTLMNRANASGFEVTARMGVPFAYFAQLRPVPVQFDGSKAEPADVTAERLLGVGALERIAMALPGPAKRNGHVPA